MKKIFVSMAVFLVATAAFAGKTPTFSTGPTVSAFMSGGDIVVCWSVVSQGDLVADRYAIDVTATYDLTSCNPVEHELIKSGWTVFAPSLSTTIPTGLFQDQDFLCDDLITPSNDTDPSSYTVRVKGLLPPQGGSKKSQGNTQTEVAVAAEAPLDDDCDGFDDDCDGFIDEDYCGGGDGNGACLAGPCFSN